TSYHPVMKTSGITAALPAQDLGRAKAFYVEKVGLEALESGFLEARDGQVVFTVGDGVSQFFVYPARVRSSGEFTQAVIHVTDVRAAGGQMRAAACSSRSTTRRRRGPRAALPGCRVVARRRGLRTRKATWSALSQPEGNQARGILARLAPPPEAVERRVAGQVAAVTRTRPAHGPWDFRRRASPSV